MAVAVVEQARIAQVQHLLTRLCLTRSPLVLVVHPALPMLLVVLVATPHLMRSHQMAAGVAAVKTKGLLLIVEMVPVVAVKEILAALARLAVLMETLVATELAALSFVVVAVVALARQEPRHQIRKLEMAAMELHHPYQAQALLMQVVVVVAKAIRLLAALEARAAGVVLVKMLVLQTLVVAAVAVMEAGVLVAQAVQAS
jgi:hypothetical protein